MNSQRTPHVYRYNREELNNMNSKNHDFSYEAIIDYIRNTYQKAFSEIGKCNILVIGKTGVGKSTLINAVFREPLAKVGVGEPVTQDIRKYSKKDFPITVYDTPGLEIDGEQIKRVMEDVSNLIKKNQDILSEQIHIVWYCISHNANRLEHQEEQWIKILSKVIDIPVILIVTQTFDTEKNSQFITYLKNKNLPVTQIIPVLAEPKKFSSQFTIPQHGLDTLANVTFELLPEAIQKAFANATKSIRLKARKASRYVAGYVTAAGAVGAIPIPWSDAPLLAGAQITMLVNITVIFGLPFDDGFAHTIVSSIVGVGGGTLLGRTIVANLLKMIPGVGTVLGAFISSATACAITLALGLAYIEALKKYMIAELEGRKMTRDEVAKLLIEIYKDYVKFDLKTLKNHVEVLTNTPTT